MLDNANKFSNITPLHSISIFTHIARLTDQSLSDTSLTASDHDRDVQARSATTPCVALVHLRPRHLADIARCSSLANIT
jgi:hypothetical protein